MNKKLLTLAIGAALGAAPMFANAAATVYGAAHMSVDSLDNGNTATATTNNTLTTLSNNASYIGIKADEDLGGGVKAFFDAQLQLTLDIASTNFSNRNTIAGLSGGFGKVFVGNYDDVLKQVGRKVDMFMSEQLGESRSLTHVGVWDARLANSVTYETPSMGGVTVMLNYGMANSSVYTTALTATALGVQYSGGPLYVGAAYKTVDALNGTVVDTTTGMRVAASYTIVGLTVGGLYQKVDGVTAATDRDTYGLGVSYKIGNGKIKGQYYVADDIGTTANSGATLMAVGYDHSLSKTTTVYAVYATVKNDTAAAFQVVSSFGHGTNPDSGSFAPTANGNDGSGISVGMKMAF